MQNVICFAIGNKNYLNPIRVSIGSFCEYNNSKLIVYLTDNSSEFFKSEFHYDNVEFVDIKDTKSEKYFKDNYDKFAESVYTFSKDHLFDVFVANELLDRTITKYKNETRAILRLDMDTLFLSSIEESVQKFIDSDYLVGACIEKQFNRDMYHVSNCITWYVRLKYYMNMGNFIVRVNENTITDHFERTLNIFKTHNLSHLYYPDQDAINIIYENNKSYNMNKDGWILSIGDIKDYTYVNKPIFIHYAGTEKPFVRGSVTWIPEFVDTYKVYYKHAIKFICDENFLKSISGITETIREEMTRMSGPLVVSHITVRSLLRHWKII